MNNEELVALLEWMSESVSTNGLDNTMMSFINSEEGLASTIDVTTEETCQASIEGLIADFKKRRALIKGGKKWLSERPALDQYIIYVLGIRAYHMLRNPDFVEANANTKISGTLPQAKFGLVIKERMGLFNILAKLEPIIRDLPATTTTNQDAKDPLSMADGDGTVVTVIKVAIQFGEILMERTRINNIIKILSEAERYLESSKYLGYDVAKPLPGMTLIELSKDANFSTIHQTCMTMSRAEKRDLQDIVDFDNRLNNYLNNLAQDAKYGPLGTMLLQRQVRDVLGFASSLTNVNLEYYLISKQLRNTFGTISISEDLPYAGLGKGLFNKANH